MSSASAPDPADGVRTLTPELAAAERTYRRLMFETFPFELRLGHRLGFIRAFASPRIATLLAGTGQIEHDTSRRGTDTGLFMYSMLYHGLDSAVGRQAVERLNQMHAVWPIRNEDYVWSLGNWFLPGLDVVDRYGWRPLTDAERQAVVDWHRELGIRMGVQGIPCSADAFAAMARDYEQDHLSASAAGRRLRAAAFEVAVRSLPRPLRAPGLRVGTALLDAPVREALGLPEPAAVVRVLAAGLLRAGAVVRRRRGPGEPWFVPGAPRRDYPHGYTIEDLGPTGTRSGNG